MARRVKINPDRLRRATEQQEEDRSDTAYDDGNTDWEWAKAQKGYTSDNGWQAWEPNDKQRQVCQNLAGLGLSERNICRIIGVSQPTLDRWLTNELEMGRAMANGIVANKLFNHCLAGNLSAIMFWMRTRMGWVEPKAPIDEDQLKEDFSKLTDEQLEREIKEFVAREDVASKARSLAKTLQKQFA